MQHYSRIFIFALVALSVCGAATGQVAIAPGGLSTEACSSSACRVAVQLSDVLPTDTATVVFYVVGENATDPTCTNVVGGLLENNSTAFKQGNTFVDLTQAQGGSMSVDVAVDLPASGIYTLWACLQPAEGEGDTAPVLSTSLSTIAAASDAYLRSLSLEAAGATVPLTPAFVFDTLEYSVDIAYDVDELDLTATASFDQASIAVVVGGEDSPPQDVAVPIPTAGFSTTEPNIVDMTVTAEDGSTLNHYVLRVSKDEAPDSTPPSWASNDYPKHLEPLLSSAFTLLLKISEPGKIFFVTLTAGDTAPASVDDVIAQGEEIVVVNSDVEVERFVDSLPAAAGGGSELEVYFVLQDDAGNKSPTFTLHTITLPPASTDAFLVGLSLNGTTLSPEFQYLETSYSASPTPIPFADSCSLHVQATLSTLNASASVFLDVDDPGQHQEQVTDGRGLWTLSALDVGQDMVLVVAVTSEDSSANTEYKIGFSRDEVPSQTITSLWVSEGGGLSPSFDAESTNSYSVTVPYDTTQLAVTAVGLFEWASCGLTAAVVSDAAPDNSIVLSDGQASTPLVLQQSGDTTLEVTVGVEGSDASSLESYTIVIVREARFAFGPLMPVELMYAPSSDTGSPSRDAFDATEYEYIVLKNMMNPEESLTTDELSEYSLAGVVAFDFSDALEDLQGGVRGVFARNREAFEARYDLLGDDVVLLGVYGDSISFDNTAGVVSLVHTNDTTPLWSFTYSSSLPWPQDAGGAGKSIVLLSDTASPADPTNWQASPEEFGSIPLKSGTPLLILSPEEIDFGNDLAVNGARSPAQELQIGNNGTDMLVFSVSIEPESERDQFIVTELGGSGVSGTDFEIVPQGAQTLHVEVVPLRVGNASAALVIESNDASRSPFNVNLTATIHEAGPAIIRISVVSPWNDLVTIKNYGEAPMDVSTLRLAIADDHIIDVDSSEVILGKDEEHDVSVVLSDYVGAVALLVADGDISPDTLIHFMAYYGIPADNPSAGLLAAAVTHGIWEEGVYISPAASPPFLLNIVDGNDTLHGLEDWNTTAAEHPTIGVDPLEVYFGERLVENGSAPLQTVTVRNSGDGLLMLSAYLEGDDAGEFSVSMQDGTSPDDVGVLPFNDDHAVLQLAFDPTSAGEKNANLTITSNDPDSPSVTVALHGTGSGPNGPAIIRISVVSPWNDLVTIKNYGEAPMDVSTLRLAIADDHIIDVDSSEVILGKDEEHNVSVVLSDYVGAVALLVADGDISPDTLIHFMAYYGIPADNPSAGLLAAAVTHGIWEEGVYISPAASPPFLLNIVDGNDALHGLEDWNTTEAEHPTIGVDPLEVYFGERLVENGPAPLQTVTVRNSGDGLLMLSAYLEGDDAGEFSVSMQDGTSPDDVGVLPFNDDHAVLQLAFDPTSAGEKNANLTITSNDPSLPSVSVSLHGTGAVPTLLPILTVDINKLYFATRMVGSGPSVAKSVTVSNTGEGDLVMSTVIIHGAEVAAEDFALVQSDDLPITVAPGGTTQLSFTFDPVQAGNRSTYAEIHSEYIDELQTIWLIGMGTTDQPPMLTVNNTDSDIVFADRAINSGPSPPVVIDISNTGEGDLVVSVTIEGSSDDEFVVATSAANGEMANVMVATDEHLLVSVSFSPNVIGILKEASLLVTSNDPVHETIVWTLHGNGTISGPVPVASVRPTEVDFGVREAGLDKPSAPQYIVVTNKAELGGAVLHVSRLFVNDRDQDVHDFSITSHNGDGFTVQPTAAVDVAVVFAPKRAGDRTTSVEIETNDPSNPVITVTLKGQGTGSVCGNGVIEEGESCEIEDAVDSPGCAACVVVPGYQCQFNSALSPPQSTCGTLSADNGFNAEFTGSETEPLVFMAADPTPNAKKASSNPVVSVSYPPGLLIPGRRIRFRFMAQLGDTAGSKLPTELFLAGPAINISPATATDQANFGGGPIVVTAWVSGCQARAKDSHLGLYVFDEQASEWKNAELDCPLADRYTQFDQDTCMLTAHVCHLSDFAVLGNYYSAGSESDDGSTKAAIVTVVLVVLVLTLCTVYLMYRNEMGCFGRSGRGPSARSGRSQTGFSLSRSSSRVQYGEQYDVDGLDLHLDLDDGNQGTWVDMTSIPRRDGGEGSAVASSASLRQAPRAAANTTQGTGQDLHAATKGIADALRAQETDDIELSLTGSDTDDDDYSASD